MSARLLQELNTQAARKMDNMSLFTNRYIFAFTSNLTVVIEISPVHFNIVIYYLLSIILVIDFSNGVET